MSHEENQLDVNLEKDSMAMLGTIQAEAKLPGRWNWDSVFASIASVLILIFVVMGSWWLYVTFWSYPRTKIPAPSKEISDAVVSSVVEAIPGGFARVEYREGGNVDIFVARSGFESIPYPDREMWLKQISGRWARTVDHTYCPTLRVKDIRNGETLAYNCPKLHRFGVADIK